METPKTKPSDESPEFKRFRELTGNLLQVPKSEVKDKMKARVSKRAKYKKQK